MCFSFRFVQECVESDPELSDEQRQKLHFVPEHLDGEVEDESKVSDGEDTERPVDAVVRVLKEYAKDIKEKVSKNPTIKKATKQILSDCVKKIDSGVDETDSGEMGHLSIDLNRLWLYISDVFRIFFADLESPDGTKLQ